MPPTGTTVAPTYALLGVARLGATRLGHVSPLAYVSLDGIHYGTGAVFPTQRILVDSLTITDTLDDTPNTASLTVKGFTPTLGVDVVITRGSKNGIPWFTGTVLRGQQSFAAQPAHVLHHLSLIDHTWGLNTRKISGHFTGSATTIAKAWIATYAPRYTSVGVAPGLPTVDGGITVTFQDLTSALAQLAKRIGAEWRVVGRDVRFFLPPDTEGTPPSDLTVSNPLFLLDSPVSVSRDLSAFITRVYVEGRGPNALGAVGVGDTMIPVEHVDWYPVPGVVVSGPQRISYTGVIVGGGGTLVGPGLAPAAAPTATLQNGTEIESGVHEYAVTFQTAAGESIPGPRRAITTGLITAPVTAPFGVAIVGAGVDTGAHDYEYTLVNGTGQTTPSTASGSVTTGPITGGTLANPSSAPSVALDDGMGMDVGTFVYAVSFTNAVGKTLPSPLSGSITTGTGGATPPGSFDLTGVTASTSPAGSLDSDGIYQWKYTFRRTSDGAETTPSPATPNSSPIPAGNSVWFLISSLVAPPSGYVHVLYRTDGGPGATFKECTSTVTAGGYIKDVQSDASLGSAPPTVNETGDLRVTVTNIPIGPSGTTGREVYRTVAGGSQQKFLQAIANNTATQITDSSPDASLGANAPTVNTTGTTVNWNQVTVTIPVHTVATVTAINLFRRFNATGTYKLVAALSAHATSYTDAIANASLGAAAPSTNTATANRVDLTNIPIGPTGTTGRGVYRTRANLSQLYAVVFIANNTATTYSDAFADASITSVAPTSDTSGLTQPDGQVLAGASSIVVAGPGAFSATGGWAVVGNGQQVVRYTGVAAGALTGIPATGVIGAITSTISYNSSITAAPCLTGIPATGAGSILYPILKGEGVNLLVQVDDLDAQTELAALIGGDGIQEDYLQDRRLSFEEATARGEAHLLARNQINVAISYQTRDRNTRAGQTITVNLGAPTNVTGAFTIQSVTLADFHPTAGPTYTVQASTHRFSFADLLRLERAA